MMDINVGSLKAKLGTHNLAPTCRSSSNQLPAQFYSAGFGIHRPGSDNFVHSQFNGLLWRDTLVFSCLISYVSVVRRRPRLPPVGVQDPCKSRGSPHFEGSYVHSQGCSCKAVAQPHCFVGFVFYCPSAYEHSTTH